MMFAFVATVLIVSGSLVWAQSNAFSAPAHSGGSLIVDRHRVTIKRGPSQKTKLRGMAVKGSRLPILESQAGEGCDGLWYRIHQEGWVCEDDVSLNRESPLAVSQPPMDGTSVTPWPYGFVREDTIEYKWSRHGWMEEVREIFRGFGFGVEKKVTVDGEKYFKTPEGKLIPTNASGISRRISTFQGVKLGREDHFPVGWVNARLAWVYSAPGKNVKTRVRQLARYDFFKVLGEADVGRHRFYQLGENAWISSRDVRVATRAKRPKEVTENERWVDVDIKQQVATAYVGDTPVYATLVSTGRWGASRTVKGQFRIWVKVAAIAMDNTDEEEELDTDVDTDTGDTDTATDVERKLYSLQDVPWTQFFHESYAIHAVYWHNRFGNRKSHGCVNLAPIDARWFYDWTAPHVPDGWWSIYSTDADQGTMVRVR